MRPTENSFSPCLFSFLNKRMGEIFSEFVSISLVIIFPIPRSINCKMSGCAHIKREMGGSGNLN